MVILRHQQQTIFDVLSDRIFADHEFLRWPEWLRQIDQVLEDEELVEIVQQALARRRPLSRTRGRHSTPAEVVLRLVMLKRLRNWTYEELEMEVRANLMYRRFTRIGSGKVPDAKTILRLEHCLGETTLRTLHERIVRIARRSGVVRGRKMRVDTTVVESNIHYPTDSTLLSDAVRVITRTVQRLRATVAGTAVRFRNRTRGVSHRVLEIARATRSRIPSEARKRVAYERLLGTVGAVLRDARRVLTQTVADGVAQSGNAASRTVQRLSARLEAFGNLTEKVIAQTRARVLEGDVHFPGKLLSLFETETELIRKGKRSKPTEFGKVVKIQEAENQVITSYEISARRPADSELLIGSAEEHIRLLGRAPELLAADAAFWSTQNEQKLTALGVKKVAIPNRSTRSPARRAFERQRWFRRAHRWRVGCEGRISTLKRGRGMARCRYKGPPGMVRCVALAVITNNLIQIARYKTSR